jgi:hypothetical protein
LKRVTVTQKIGNKELKTRPLSTWMHRGHTQSRSWSDSRRNGLFINILKGSRLIINFIHVGEEMGLLPNCKLILKSGTKISDYHNKMY